MKIYRDAGYRLDSNFNSKIGLERHSRGISRIIRQTIIDIELWHSLKK